MQNKKLYVCDSYDMKEYALNENMYHNVVIKNYQLHKTFYEHEVFHFKLNNEKIKSVIDNMYASYGKLLSTSMNYYKRSNALRALLRMEGVRAQNAEEQKKLEDMFNAQLKAFMTAEGSAVLPLQKGIEFDETQKLSNSGNTSRDVRALVDDIFDFVSMAFLIPKGLLKSDLADVENQTNNFLMFCVAPIAELIEDEINRKFYSKDEYLERTYLKIDTSLIKYVDIVSIAGAFEKLLSSGAHSVNDNLRLIDKEPINEDWAEQHFITKNYEEIQKFLKGGEKDD